MISPYSTRHNDLTPSCSHELRRVARVLVLWSVIPIVAFSQTIDSANAHNPDWHFSIQYLGITYHPNGGNTPEVYPLKFDRKAFVVLDVGFAANLDYQIADWSFIRLSTSLYKDCAFLTAGCVHFGPRFELSWGGNALNVGIGPIFSFRRDWHRFGQYTDDEFYGRRVYHGWQYRFFPTAIEFEYLRRINESTEFQWSVIPGGPLIITSLFGIRYAL